jgi:hypothetical protein
MDQKEMVERLKQNPAALKSVMQSQDGQRLMQLLSGNDGGKTLNRAAMQATGGNTAEMVRLISGIMQSADGAALVERINKSLQQ